MSRPADHPHNTIVPRATADNDALDLTAEPDAQPPHVAIYLRVSTGEQSVDHQRADCYATAEREFGNVPTVAYPDEGMSASKHDMIDREKARGMLDAIERGEVVGVVTWAQDRLSRRGSGEMEVFLDLCRRHGVRVVSATEGELHHDDMGGEIVTSIRAVMAKYESIGKGNRSKSGQLALARAGKWPKGPTPPGYDRDPTKILVTNATAPFIIEAFERFDRGVSRNALAAWLTDTDDKPWSRSRVVDMLRNPAYIGRIVHGGEDHPGLHQPLISVELFERVQGRLNDAAGFDMRKNRRSPFGAMFRCACGGQLHHHSEKRRGLDHHDYECHTQGCTQRIHAEALDLYYVLTMKGAAAYLRERLADPGWRNDTDPTEELELRGRLDHLQQQRRRLMPLVADGDTIAKEVADEARREAEAVQRRLNRLTASWESKREMLQGVVDAWRDDFDWTTATVEERHAVVVASTESICAEQDDEGRSILRIRPRGFPGELAPTPIYRDRRGAPHHHIRSVGFGVPCTADSRS